MEPDRVILLRAKLIRLSEEKEIRKKEKDIEQASAEELEAIMKDYKDKKLESINNLIAEHIVEHGSRVLARVGLIDSPNEVEKELSDIKPLKDDIVWTISHITHWLPYPGLIIASLIIAKHIAQKYLSEEPKEEKVEKEE